MKSMAKFDVDSALVRKLADLLEETGLGEIEYEADGKRIRVVQPSLAAHGGAPAATPVVTAAASAPPVAGPPPAADESSHPGAVLSPMVGTVYLATSPDDPPLVRVGDQVHEGQTLMLVEAMKTFNEIKAGRSGALTRLLVENGRPVEYGEVLAIIE